jgi:hypothetical protein
MMLVEIIGLDCLFDFVNGNGAEHRIEIVLFLFCFCFLLLGKF